MFPLFFSLDYAHMKNLSFLVLQQYGADIVYSEEIIDKRITQCQRVENKETGTIDFVMPGVKGAVTNVFSTYTDEPVVFQMGTAGAAEALLAAQTVCRDVRAIDVNMGCPKHFSISGGYVCSLFCCLLPLCIWWWE